MTSVATSTFSTPRPNSRRTIWNLAGARYAVPYTAQVILTYLALESVCIPLSNRLSLISYNRLPSVMFWRLHSASSCPLQSLYLSKVTRLVSGIILQRLAWQLSLTRPLTLHSHCSLLLSRCLFAKTTVLVPQTWALSKLASLNLWLW
jgi:hypothetical protein